MTSPLWPGGPRSRPGDDRDAPPQVREVNSVLPADPEASSHAETQRTTAYGESRCRPCLRNVAPEACVAREAFEETGVSVSNMEFVAITNDVLADVGKHYLTVWFRADADNSEPVIRDTREIVEVGWFKPGALPKPLHLYFENLLAGRCLPPNPQNLPFAIEPR